MRQVGKTFSQLIEVVQLARSGKRVIYIGEPVDYMRGIFLQALAPEEQATVVDRVVQLNSGGTVEFWSFWKKAERLRGRDPRNTSVVFDHYFPKAQGEWVVPKSKSEPVYFKWSNSASRNIHKNRYEIKELWAVRLKMSQQLTEGDGDRQ